MKHFAKAVYYHEERFASKKERDFFIRFIEKSGKRYKVHPSFMLKPKIKVCGYNQFGIGYTPDFVIYGSDGSIEHVYDVKSGINSRAVDTAAKIRFKLFQAQHNIPVEVVVPRKHDFKMKLFGFTNPYIQAKHVRHSRSGREVHEYYDVHKTINYDIHDTVGW